MYLFESERLQFRKLNSDDAASVYQYHQEPGVKKWIPNESYQSIDKANRAIDFFNACVDRNTFPFVLGIESKKSNELVGDIGINEVEGSPEELEVGFCIRTCSQGKGYAQEALCEMIIYLAKEFNIQKLYGRVLEGNATSVKVLEKVGFYFQKVEYEAPDDSYGKGMRIYVWNR